MFPKKNQEKHIPLYQTYPKSINFDWKITFSIDSWWCVESLFIIHLFEEFLAFTVDQESKSMNFDWRITCEGGGEIIGW